MLAGRTPLIYGSRRFAVLIAWQQGVHHTVAASIASWHPRPENPLAGEACTLGDALGGQVLRHRDQIQPPYPQLIEGPARYQPYRDRRRAMPACLTAQPVTDRGQLGIMEPSPQSAVVEPDIVLVPLAAFDRVGHRIGYGAGHYDRTLEQLRTAKPIVAIGLAFAVQEIEAIPALSHDVRLDYMLTDIRTIDFRSS